MSFELKCPECGNDGSESDSRIARVEYTPTFHYVAAIDGKTLYLDHDNYMDGSEEGGEAKLFCYNCDHEWDIPQGVIFEGLGNFGGYRFLDGSKAT